METFSQSVLWLFLVGKESDAVEQCLFVVKRHLPLQNPHNVDIIMALLLPTILVLKFVGRGEDAHFILCKYVINAHYDFAPTQTYWVDHLTHPFPRSRASDGAPVPDPAS